MSRKLLISSRRLMQSLHHCAPLFFAMLILIGGDSSCFLG